jgi:hypothetical protein
MTSLAVDHVADLATTPGICLCVNHCPPHCYPYFTHPSISSTTQCAALHHYTTLLHRSSHPICINNSGNALGSLAIRWLFHSSRYISVSFTSFLSLFATRLFCTSISCKPILTNNENRRAKQDSQPKKKKKKKNEKWKKRFHMLILMKNTPI